jgi:hypothetical protein
MLKLNQNEIKKGNAEQLNIAIRALKLQLKTAQQTIAALQEALSEEQKRSKALEEQLRKKDPFREIESIATKISKE